MRNNFSLLTLVLLFTMGIGQMWGATVSWTSANQSALPSYIGSGEIVACSGTNTAFNGSGDSKVLRMVANSASVTLSTSLSYKITSITIKVVGRNNSPYGLSCVNTTAWSPSGCWKKDNTVMTMGSTSAMQNGDYTFTPSSPAAGASYSIYVYKAGASSSTRADWSQISVTYESAGTCSETAPAGASVTGGNTYTKGDALTNLTATTTAGTNLTYQWYRNTENTATVSEALKLANCTTATLAPTNKVGTYYYYYTASNCAGTVTSSVGAVTINANCPSSGDYFSFTMNSSAKPGSEQKAPASGSMSIDQYLNIDGGNATIGNVANSQKSSVTTTSDVKLTATTGYLQLDLDCAIAAGDVITIAKNSNKICISDGYKSSGADGTTYTTATSSESVITVGSTSGWIGKKTLYIWYSNGNVNITAVTINRPVYRKITLEYADGTTADGELLVEDGKKATKPADPTWAHHRFDGWYDGSDPYDWSETVGGDLTLTAHWTQLYTVTYAKGDDDATGDAPTQADKAASETFKVAANTFELAGKLFDYWTDGVNNYNPDDTYTVGTSNVTLTAVWRTPATMYAITKGDHDNGDFTIDPTSQEAGETVTLSATPDEDYLFSAWEVVKTEDGSATGITVDANGQFEMPAYAVTVNATFVADTRAKVLYVTSTSASDTKANDKLYDALKDTYNVKIVGPASDADQSGYALIVLHESIDGKNDYNKTAVATAKTGSIPVLNTKSYFYPSGRWNWGTPNAGTSVKGATMNSAYCNIADHPLFNDVTVSEGFIEITDDAAAKCMQPVGSFTSGYEGYTLATTPNAESGNGCAIHEIPAGTTARGVSSGKYLMISVSNAKLDALNANGQKLFQNAAAYLIDGSASWTPIVVPTVAAITADPNAAYFVGDNIALTASATGTSAATTYTWYKGDNLAAAKEAGALKATATAAAGGNTYGVTGCALADAGTYWCVISNGTDCEAAASLAVTVSDVSYDIAFVSAHGTAPSATTGVSYTLPELSADGWAHQGWTANINVTVDAEEVTAGTTIANGKLAVFGADVTFTAVWVQVFDVTFNLQDHGAAVATQHIQNGGKVTEPNDPFEVGQIFGGWYKEAACTNEWDFANDVVTDDTELFSKWTAFDGCVELWPATSGDAPAVGDEINMQSGSNGATMTVMAVESGTFAYTSAGLQFGSNAGPKVSVVLNNEMSASEGTKISITLVAGGTNTRGLNLYDANGNKIDAFTCWVKDVNPATNGAEETFTYTVVENDGLDGANEFQLARNNTVYLKALKVESCGAAIVYHGLTSAVDPTGKGTVTLGASSVREGLTTTATYSDIASGYEFVSWSVTGEGASIADASANPAVITMGTEDAVVTLNLQVETPKHTVTYNMMDHGVAPASELVKEGDKVTKPADPEADGYYFRGWYKENSLETAWDFANDVMGTSDMSLFAKWEADPCTNRQSIVKMVMTAPNAATVTGYNTNEYAGGFITNNLNSNSSNISTHDFGDGNVTGYKLAGDKSAVFATLAKGGFQEGDKVVIALTTAASSLKLAIYAAKDKDNTLLLGEIDAAAAGVYTYTITAANVDAIEAAGEDYMSIGTIRGSYNPYVYSVELTGCRNWSVFHNIEFRKADESVVAAKTLAEGEFASTVAPADPKVNGYRFLGWSTTKNDATAIVDLTAYTITADAVLYAIYEEIDCASAGTKFKFQMKTDLTSGNMFSSAPNSASMTTDNYFSELVGGEVEASITGTNNNRIVISDQKAIGFANGSGGTITISLDCPLKENDEIRFINYANSGNSITLSDGTNSTTLDGNKSTDVQTFVVPAAWETTGSYELTMVRGGNTAKLTYFEIYRRPVLTAVELADMTMRVGQTKTPEMTLTPAAGLVTSQAWTIESATPTGIATINAATGAISATAEGTLTVKVVLNGNDALTDECTVTIVDVITQQNVTKSTIWNWQNASSVNEIKLTDSTDPKKNEGFVMANVNVYNNTNFESDKLYVEGEYIVRDGKYFQGQLIKFNATVAGLVHIKFSNTGGNPARELYINGVGTGNTSASGTMIYSDYVEVPAGEVSITAYLADKSEDASQKYIRVSEIEFRELTHRRTSAYAVGDLGTVCLKDASKVIGANLYELVGFEEHNYLAFDEIENGEMEAGKPYLFEVTNPSQVSFYGAVDGDHTETAASTNGMYGTFENKNISGEDMYYFSGRHIWAVKDFNVEYITIPANRCYLDITEVPEPSQVQAPAPGRRRVTMGVNGKNTATGFENIEASEKPMKIMINGQIFILRGEKMFDATGRLVK